MHTMLLPLGLVVGATVLNGDFSTYDMIYKKHAFLKAQAGTKPL
jgi:hypothetical protein